MLNHLKPLSNHVKVENLWLHPLYHGGTACPNEDLYVYVFSEEDYDVNKSGLCYDHEEFMKKQRIYGLGINENGPTRKGITDCEGKEIKNTISYDEIFEFINQDYCK